jgi:hypothetical protein
MISHSLRIATTNFPPLNALKKRRFKVLPEIERVKYALPRTRKNQSSHNIENLFAEERWKQKRK